MAKVSFTMPDDFLLQVSKLAEKTDEILPEVLAAGAEVVEDKVRANLSSAIGRNTKEKSQSTGKLLSALGTSPAKPDKDGNYDIKIGFAENRSDGKRNAMLAAILEYGKSGQPPKPFLKPAKSASKNECIKAMGNKLNEEIGKV